MQYQVLEVVCYSELASKAINDNIEYYSNGKLINLYINMLPPFVSQFNNLNPIYASLEKITKKPCEYKNLWKNMSH